MNELIQPEQYDVPDESSQRTKFAMGAVWVGIPMLLITLSATLYLAFTGVETGGLLAMVGLDLTVAGVLSWALYSYYTRANFSYEVLGIDVTFDGDDYYVPAEEMLKLVRAVMNTWSGHLDVDPKEVYDGVSLTVLTRQPDHPYERGQKAVGLTYHQTRRSLIWGPYALNTGGAGYELMLHAAQYKWPDADEGEKIERMGELGIFEALRHAYRNELGE